MTKSESFLFGGDTPWRLKAPDGLVVLKYGGGVNTIAVAVLCRRLGLRPRAIVMSDPGSEKRASIAYRENVARPWFASIGFPDITIITRAEEAQHRPSVELTETLIQECERTASLPSAAYGLSRCTDRHKASPFRWWLDRQRWAQEEWQEAKEGRSEVIRGRKIVLAIGYDADEPHRIVWGFKNHWEHLRCVPWYPNHEAGLSRNGCADLIRSEADLVAIAEAAGVSPVPTKSACKFCPNQGLDEWEELRRDDPDAWEDALTMSRRAEKGLSSPDVVGLMRTNPEGRRQLHVWAAGGYGSMPIAEAAPMPCECAL